jgi:xanthine dehydrogenase accessory factor
MRSYAWPGKSGKTRNCPPAFGFNLYGNAMSFPATESDVLAIAAHWLDQGHGVALATVVRTAGSAPRQGGSHIVVRGDGAFAGSVSAGCVEGAVIEAAQEALADGRHRRLTFGVSDGGVFETGLLCGGEIEILVEPIL